MSVWGEWSIGKHLFKFSDYGVQPVNECAEFFVVNSRQWSIRGIGDSTVEVDGNSVA
jgi:hypothetical protein